MMADSERRKTSVFLAERVHKALRMKAAEEGRSLSDVAAELLEASLLPKTNDAADKTDKPTVN